MTDTKTTLTIGAESHLDHGVGQDTIEWLQTLEFPTGEVTVQTLELPEHLPDLECALYGDTISDGKIQEAEVVYRQRGDRAGKSRVLLWSKPRPTRLITVVVGPHTSPAYLYTCYGGPQAPREPFEFELNDSSTAAKQSREFWADHALALGEK